jgi:hypothetical protein
MRQVFAIASLGVILAGFPGCNARPGPEALIEPTYSHREAVIDASPPPAPIADATRNEGP